MARHILMAGKSGASRRNIEACILVMFEDVVISKVESIEQAKEARANNHIHLVIYALEANDVAGLDFCAGMSESCIVLAHNKSVLSEASKRGIANVLEMPCSAVKLEEVINQVCNPISLRTAQRYSILGTVALIEQQSLRVDATVLNISSGGVLCEFAPSPMLNLCEPVMITLQFTENNPILSETQIYSILSSMKVVECNSDNIPLKVRVGFKFISLQPEVIHALNSVLDNAGSY